MKRQRVVIEDLMQKDFSYFLTEPLGKNFHKTFCPELTPKEMLELGVFGGKYMTDCTLEFPSDWFDNALLCSQRHNPELNYFNVNASQPLAFWRKKNWIYVEDPRGWFQWYCRYYMGRRCIDDERQIKRWQAMQRHISQIKIMASKVIWNVELNSVRQFFTGLMIQEKFSLLVKKCQVFQKIIKKS